jgi:hypothetical protein
VLVPRVSGVPMFVGCAVGAAIELWVPFVFYYPVPPEQRISFVWLGVPGLAAALLIPLTMSVVWPQVKDMTGLTLWTVGRARPDPATTDEPTTAGEVATPPAVAVEG